MPQKNKSIPDLLCTLIKEELLELIQDCCLFWNVTEERIMMAKINVAQKKAEAAFEAYRAIEYPDSGLKESVYHSILAKRAEAYERCDRLAKRNDRLWAAFNKMRKSDATNQR